jgi:hypothetical protein
MADYSLECRNPACGWNGFNGHSPGCTVPLESAQRQRELKEKHDKEDAEGRAYWEALPKEQMFAELKALEEQIKAARALERKRNYAYDVLRSNWQLRNYLDYRKTD